MLYYPHYNPTFLTKQTQRLPVGAYDSAENSAANSAANSAEDRAGNPFVKVHFNSLIQNAGSAYREKPPARETLVEHISSSVYSIGLVSEWYLSGIAEHPVFRLSEARAPDEYPIVLQSLPNQRCSCSASQNQSHKT